MTGAAWVTRADRARWQRQATAELAAILAAHPGLPPIAWTVSPAGAVLAGRVNGLAPAGRAREAFSAWQAALALEETREHQLSGGVTWLCAAARRDQVTIRLTATVFDDQEDGQ